MSSSIALPVLAGWATVSAIAAGAPIGSSASPFSVFGIACGCSARAVGVSIVSRLTIWPELPMFNAGPVACDNLLPSTGAALVEKWNRVESGLLPDQLLRTAAAPRCARASAAAWPPWCAIRRTSLTARCRLTLRCWRATVARVTLRELWRGT
jgi:hypothetical protein